MNKSEIYSNKRRLGQPFVYKDMILVEHEAGRVDKLTSELEEFVSCIHVKSPQKGKQFGGGMCVKCTIFLEEHSQEFEDAMIKAGWKKK